MEPVLEGMLEQGGGVLARNAAVLVVPAHRFDLAVRRDELRRVFRNAYVRPEDFLDGPVRRTAALVSVGPHGVLSHLSALQQWGLGASIAPWYAELGISFPDVHITVGRGQPRRQEGLVPHRRSGCRPGSSAAILRSDLPTVRLERALVESWPLIDPFDQRAPIIHAVRERRTTPDRIRSALAGLPRLAGLARLLALLELLAGGSHSELEIWGFAHVFRHPAMPPVRRQLPIALGSQRVYVDLAVEEVLLAIELDGRRHHAGIADIERDRRRDVGLAALGWQTLRFSGRRLHNSPAEVLSETLTVIETRRRMLRAA